MSDYYDLPFNDILDWRKFAVVLRERDVYDLKQILKNITQSEFVSLHNNLVKVKDKKKCFHMCHCPWCIVERRQSSFTSFAYFLRREILFPASLFAAATSLVYASLVY